MGSIEVASVPFHVADPPFCGHGNSGFLSVRKDLSPGLRPSVSLNDCPLTGSQLQEAFNRGLPRLYDQQFPDQQWTTYLLLDAHSDKRMVAITVGLSPRVGAKKALLPIASFSARESNSSE
jgi:hypothetical protein